MRSRVLCPRCGEPIALDHAGRLMQGHLALPILALCPVLVLGMGLAVPLFVRHDWFMVAFLPGTMLLAGAPMITLCWLIAANRLDLEQFSSALGLFYRKSVSRDELSNHLSFPLVQRASSASYWTDGSFLDTRVILCQLGSGRWWQAVAIFYNTIPGLPDFELVPNRSWQEIVTSAPSNTFAFKDAAVTDEPFEEQYEIQANDTEAVLAWLGPEQRKLLACYPGWHVQAFEGRVLITRPGMICMNNEWPTLLALTWRMYRIIVPRYRESTV
jgi:hypothetical protein